MTYLLAAGTGSDKFAIDSSTGRLVVADGAEFDYETDSSLEVTVQATDGKNAGHYADSAIDDAITVTIELVNVDEPGEVSLFSTEPEVGASITAIVTDPDGEITSTSWHWEKSPDRLTNWSPINGSTSDTYMPVSADEAMYLRSIVDSTDGEGPGRSAEGMSADTVKSPQVDTTLATLTLGGITFTFSSSTLGYDLNVPNEEESTEVTATPTASSGVSVEITPADSDPNSMGHQVDLSVGVNQITITVNEDQGTASTTYTLLVTRAEQQTLDPPQPDPDPPQQDPPADEGVGDQCQSDQDAGLIAHCSITRFAVVRVEFDGAYTVDWSEWDSDNRDVTGYTIQLVQLLYKMYYDKNGRVSDDHLVDVYESCAFVDGQWNCNGIMNSNYFEDWDGNRTQDQLLADNQDLTEWGSSLESPGLLVLDKAFVRWSGDATDPNNEPTDVVNRVKVFEMDLYYFEMHEGNQWSDRDIILVKGADGFDECRQ